MNELPRPFTMVLLAVALVAHTAAGQTSKPAIVRPTAAVEGWKPATDPVELKTKPRLDIRLTIPIKHQMRAVGSNRPSTFVAICDDNAFGPKQWSLLNLATGGLTPAFADKMKLDE